MKADKHKQLFLKKLGREIDTQIYAKFKTRREFEMTADFDHQSLLQIVKGDSEIKIYTLKKIANGLGISLSDLLAKL